jgi:sugar phosphate isomerase/epimerase
MAAELRVMLVLEPINRYEMNYLNTVSEAMAILERVDLPNVTLLLDSFHMNIEESSIPLAITQARGHIGHVHFVDSNRWPPGFGHTNMPEIYMMLKSLGYEGYLGIETLPRPTPLEAARAGIAFVRKLEKIQPWSRLPTEEA